ncbi:MAG: hypothetical protein HDS68_06240 [Bacteroidales bacterium]|nr:hypothetical protein [Bacteroidales bacterium]
MEILTKVIVEQIDRAINEKRSFAIAILPGSLIIQWFEAGECTTYLPDGTVTTSNDISFDISPWLQPFAERWTLGDGIPQWDTMYPCKKSMTYEDYINAVAQIIEICRLRNGKTVFSRTICGKTPCDGDNYSWGQTANRFFTRFHDAFRYICYSAKTGGWMGATPELLLEYNKITGQFHTVAIAGTRKKNNSGILEWDEKNIRENRFVSEYIQNVLSAIGIKVTVSPLRNVTYGYIEHLCADIYGIASPDKLSDIIDAINPTPALCGFPKNEALADLAIYEPHKRYLYGGFIGIDSVDRYRAYVNLRCIHFHHNDYCIYGGGGIVAESSPETEYEETVAKTSPLIDLLIQHDAS